MIRRAWGDRQAHRTSRARRFRCDRAGRFGLQIPASPREVRDVRARRSKRPDGARRGQGARSDPVRGRHLGDRDARLARRRRDQGREPARRRAGTPRVDRHAGRRFALFPAAEREQAQHHLQSQERARQGAAAGDDPAGRRVHRELRAGRDRAPRLRLRRGQPAQPEDRLRHDQGLRPGQPLRAVPVLRHDRAGDRRHHEHHRRAGRPPDQAGHDDRRHRHGPALRDRHPRRPVPVPADRPGPARPGGDAGRHDQLLPHRLCDPGARERALRAHRQPGGPRHDRAERHLPLQGRRPQRLRLHLLLARRERAVGAPAEGDRPRGPAGRPALRHAPGARRPRRRGRRDRAGLVPRQGQVRGDGDARAGGRAGRRGHGHHGAVRGPGHARARDLRHAWTIRCAAPSPCPAGRSSCPNRT